MNESVLFVDDEPDALSGYRRVLRNRFDMHAASDPHEGLALARSHPFAVIVADMRMPGMNGIQFLAEVREISADSVRIMLTGHADTATAIDAVNRGSIFRFLTKPCSPELLNTALQAGVDQWRLIRAEKDLLEKTLKGSVRVLIDVLELSNPVAFGRATRARRLVSYMGRAAGIQGLWQLELAALLSQLGCITVPPDVLERHYGDGVLTPEETAMIAAHPKVGAELLAHVPRLERIARIIAAQADPVADVRPEELFLAENIELLGAHMLRVALAFDRLLAQGTPPHLAAKRLDSETAPVHPKILAALAGYEDAQAAARAVREIAVRNLAIDMEAEQDIRAENGTLLVPRGRKITYPLLLRIRNFAAGVGVREPILVREG